MTIALWYCPLQGSLTYELLSQLIASFQTVFPNSPYFTPHVTIVTNLDIEEGDKDRVNEILTSCVAAIQSIRRPLLSGHEPLVTFKSCSVGKKYFQKIILNCQNNKYLQSMQKIMEELYVKKDVTLPEFDPHVSLLYSDIQPVSKAFLRIIQQRIEDSLDVKLLDDIEENKGGRENYQVKWKFDHRPTLSWNMPGKFKIVNCTGPIENWEVLGSIDV